MVALPGEPARHGLLVDAAGLPGPVQGLLIIAEQVHLSAGTVRSRLDRIRAKTGCSRRADLVRFALQAGLV
ncbi:MAG: hypothetical protein ACRDOU_29955 [Streptosporangiaceae bacterium]